jgi:ribonuclease HI
MFKAWLDGSCRGNGSKDSLGGIGVVIYQDEVLFGSLALQMVKHVTNNEAEYYALLRALTLIPKNEKTIIYSDSKLVVNQVNNAWKIKDKKLFDLKQAAQNLIKQFKYPVELIWIPREMNKQANKLAQDITSNKKSMEDSTNGKNLD